MLYSWRIPGIRSEERKKELNNFYRTELLGMYQSHHEYSRPLRLYRVSLILKFTCPSDKNSLKNLATENYLQKNKRKLKEDSAEPATRPKDLEINNSFMAQSTMRNLSVVENFVDSVREKINYTVYS